MKCTVCFNESKYGKGALYQIAVDSEQFTDEIAILFHLYEFKFKFLGNLHMFITHASGLITVSTSIELKCKFIQRIYKKFGEFY